MTPPSGTPRPEVLRRLIVQYQAELARSWVEGVSLGRMQRLEQSIKSAQSELRELEQEERRR